MGQRPLGRFGTATAVMVGSLAAWAVAVCMVLILWIGGCALALGGLSAEG